MLFSHEQGQSCRHNRHLGCRLSCNPCSCWSRGTNLGLARKQNPEAGSLKAVDSDLAENGGFMSKGLKLWPGIRLFRRVRAPILTAEPTLNLTPINWHSDMRQVSKSSVSWVKFGLLIQSYRIPYETGDSLVIKSSRAMLPVNRVWILIIGLLGRFGERRDMGKVSKKRTKGIISAQAVPGWGMPSPEGLFRDESMFRRDGPGRARFGSFYHRPRTIISGIQYDELHGLTGTLLTPHFRELDITEPPYFSDSLCFALHGLEEIGNLGSENLSIDWLFWLAVGCIPSLDGRLFSLENAHLLDFGDEGVIEEDAPQYRITYEDAHNHIESDEESYDYYPRERRDGPRTITKNTYVQNHRPPPSS